MQQSTQQSAALTCPRPGASSSVSNLKSLRHYSGVKPSAVLHFGRKAARTMVTNAEEKAITATASLVSSFLKSFIEISQLFHHFALPIRMSQYSLSILHLIVVVQEVQEPSLFFEPFLRSFVLGLSTGAAFEAISVAGKVRSYNLSK